ncbi:hypothetical protein ADL25_02290 [Streptomyces sp. NRRL F-5122]|uniref:hypothetical protein n=1 Tax=Streptomyces sp. NRRL F-5122 TaxID=1609098 RepID=UPI0007412CF6|nr:hypothetical protein [Streptomyces sp. NRRL F-5122]KUJ58473.1 hypothetical protein ADL25_02290 [Streptomyces sp. NRRL F-5122]
MISLVFLMAVGLVVAVIGGVVALGLLAAVLGGEVTAAGEDAGPRPGIPDTIRRHSGRKRLP